MINVKESKKLLAQDGKKFSDEEIKQLKDILYDMAVIEFNHFIKKDEL